MTPLAQAQDIRRITLDGRDGVPAPAVAADGFIHQVPTPALEIHPTPIRPSKGTVLIAPGGGYGLLAIGYEGREVMAMLNAAGWDAAVLLYRVNEGPDTRTLALADATRALMLLQTRGGEFGLSTARIGAMGFSAGGHLVARLAHETAPGGKAPAFFLLIYPAYLEDNGKILADVAPTGAPVFLCVGDQDHEYAPSSEAFAAACKEKGVPCEYLIAPGEGHGFGLKARLSAGPSGDKGDMLGALRKFLDALPEVRP